MKKEKHLEINENNYKGYVELYKTKLITPDREKKRKVKKYINRFRSYVCHSIYFYIIF